MNRLWLALVCMLVTVEAAAEMLPLAADPSWLRLLHYRKTWSGDWQSQITSREFFLSAEGHRNPEAEWQALSGAQPRDEQTALACRFPARILVFERLSGRSWPVPPCRDYLLWKERLSFRSLSLVYSTAYAGNPASVLGHNILKLNMQDGDASDPESGLPLLDYGLGFLARHDPEDGPVFYVWNGLFGGYPGFFVLQPYYELVNTYAYAENRDLWEFELALDPAERELFLAHVWELIHHAAAPYHFTHVNCSTMIVSLLEAIRPAWNLRERMPGLVLPHTLIQTVAQESGARTHDFWPSQKRIFQAHWQALGPLQQDLFLDWRQSPDTVALADDALLLDAVLNQLNMEKARLEMQEQGTLRAREDQLLLARSRLPAPTLRAPDGVQAGNNPLDAHALHKASLLAGRRRDQNILGLRLRWGLQDLLDDPRGFNPYYHINFLDLNLEVTEESERPAYQLEVVDLLSLNPFESVDPAASWALTVGLHDEAAGPRPHLRAAYGISWEGGPQRSLFYLLPGTNLTITSLDFVLRAGWYQAWTSRWRQLLELAPRQSRGRQSISWEGSWEQRWNLNRRWQLEWRLTRADHWQSMIGVGQFF